MLGVASLLAGGIQLGVELRVAKAYDRKVNKGRVLTVMGLHLVYFAGMFDNWKRYRISKTYNKREGFRLRKSEVGKRIVEAAKALNLKEHL